MYSTIYIPPTSTIPQEAYEKLIEFLEEHEFHMENDQGPLLTEELNEDKPTALVTDQDSTSEMDNLTMALAKELKIPLALHYDGCNDMDTCEWDLRSGIQWYDPETDKNHEYPAGCIDPEPQFDVQEILRIATQPQYFINDFLDKLKPLRLLGILPPRNNSTGSTIEKYLELKTTTKIEDAENSTSHKEEYSSIYHNGTPSADAFTEEELIQQIEELTESINV